MRLKLKTFCTVPMFAAWPKLISVPVGPATLNVTLPLNAAPRSLSVTRSDTVTLPVSVGVPVTVPPGVSVRPAGMGALFVQV